MQQLVEFLTHVFDEAMRTEITEPQRAENALRDSESVSVC